MGIDLRRSTMIRLRTMATAFIFNKDKLLFMKRADHKKLMPRGWAPIGGHLEKEELNNPLKACLREIEEETGIKASDLNSIELKYITHRRRGDEIRIQYVFFAETDKKELKETIEGQLYWIDPTEVFELHASASIKYILEHYLSVGKNMQEVLIGTMGNDNGRPIINWGVLKDWE
jgi:8-oxo-dGTP diphosphatase